MKGPLPPKAATLSRLVSAFSVANGSKCDDRRHAADSAIIFSDLIGKLLLLASVKRVAT